MIHQLENIRIVLVEPSHPGNIGSTARAMKNMGLMNLTLVSPASFPDSMATTMASGADDVLENAKVVDSVNEAIADCHLVLATTARERRISWPVITANEGAKKIVAKARDNQVAILFGRERTGLVNEELQLAQYHMYIPANPEYTSLNLSQAVQVVSYEIYQAIGKKQIQEKRDFDLATQKEIQDFYEHLFDVLDKIDFYKPTRSKQLKARLRRLFTRTQLDTIEVNILRGILTAIEDTCDA